MNTTSLKQIDNFLQEYRQSIFENRIAQVEALKLDFKRLISDFDQFRNEANEKAPFDAPSFNIFSLLRVTRDEVRTHSKFLAELLNPAGTHGQGDLFLRNFIEDCKLKYDTFPFFRSDLEQEHWNIYTEESVQEGRLDIKILNHMLSSLIVIENKIDAPEQDRQLARYQEYMKLHIRKFPTQALIYLTIRGKQSITASGHDYFRLSYHHDIFSWLQKTMPEIQAPVVRETIRQYMSIIYRL